LNKELLKQAQVRVPSAPVLVNMVSQRVKQLHAGQRPYVKPGRDEEPEDIALREIVEGKLIAEIDTSAAARTDADSGL
jgi:DNA-directed RNA polymerase subunit omega